MVKNRNNGETVLEILEYENSEMDFDRYRGMKGVVSSEVIDAIEVLRNNGHLRD